MKYTLDQLSYGGKYHEQFWNKQKNPNADIENGLANCTTFVYGDCLVDGIVPVSRIVSASKWHQFLINGWNRITYDKTKCKIGDIIQWVNKCHVARVVDIVDGEPIIAGSYYTGEHGCAYYNGGYDTRNNIHSLPQLSDFMISKYPNRFYHEWSLDEESRRVGGSPENILIMPEVVKTVKRNSKVNQIEVLTNEQNIRDNDNRIVGVARAGYYNVSSIKTNNGYDWYEVADNKYIAGVKGRVVYLPAEDEIEWETKYYIIEAECAELKERLKKINDLSK